jgi:beta-galactosidase
LLFSYDSDWVTDIQPQGKGFSALKQAFEYYSALRQLGLNVDILPPGADLDGYALVVVPSMPIIPDGLVEKLKAFTGQIIIGPRSGSKTADFAIPERLAPGPLQQLIPLTVTRVESLRPGLVERAGNGAVTSWLEHIESDIKPELSAEDGRGICYRHGSVRYAAAGMDMALLKTVLTTAANDAGLFIFDLPESIRVRRNGALIFAFNYGLETVSSPMPEGAGLLIGGPELSAADIAVWLV